MQNLTRRFATLALVLVPLAHWAWAQEHWVATWAASPQQPLQFRPPQALAGPPAATPGPPPPAALPPITSFHNQTVRMIVRTSIGGRRVRVQLSNAFGAGPLMVGTAHVALRDKESAIVAGSDRALAFNGKPAVMIPPGAQMVSDPVDLNVPSLGDL